MRPVHLRDILNEHEGKIVCVELRGELFFGTSLLVLEQVHDMLGLDDEISAGRVGVGATTGEIPIKSIHQAFLSLTSALRKCSFRPGIGKVASISTTILSPSLNSMPPCYSPSVTTVSHDKNKGIFDHFEGVEVNQRSALFMLPHSQFGREYGAVEAGAVHGKVGAETGGDRQRYREDSIVGERLRVCRDVGRSEGFSVIPSWIVLDCSMVTKIDASAANACFFPLQRMCESRGIGIVYSGLAPEMEDLLRAHRATVARNVQVFSTLYEALEWAETQLLKAVTGQRHGSNGVGSSVGSDIWIARRQGTQNRDMCRDTDGKGGRKEIDGICGNGSHDSVVRASSQGEMQGGSVVNIIRETLELTHPNEEILVNIHRYCSADEIAVEEVIYFIGDPAMAFYIVLDGQVLLEMATMKSPSLCRTEKLDAGRQASQTEVEKSKAKKEHAFEAAPSPLTLSESRLGIVVGTPDRPRRRETEVRTSSRSLSPEWQLLRHSKSTLRAGGQARIYFWEPS
ncbi:unnamed protein product [Choristocarpus tenellus]